MRRPHWVVGDNLDRASGQGATEASALCHYLQAAKFASLLLALQKSVRSKVNDLFFQCRISPSATIGGLSPRQRDEVLGLL